MGLVLLETEMVRAYLIQMAQGGRRWMSDFSFGSSERERRKRGFWVFDFFKKNFFKKRKRKEEVKLGILYVMCM